MQSESRSKKIICINTKEESESVTCSEKKKIDINFLFKLIHLKTYMKVVIL